MPGNSCLLTAGDGAAADAGSTELPPPMASASSAASGSSAVSASSLALKAEQAAALLRRLGPTARPELRRLFAARTTGVPVRAP